MMFSPTITEYYRLQYELHKATKGEHIEYKRMNKKQSSIVKKLDKLAFKLAEASSSCCLDY